MYNSPLHDQEHQNELDITEMEWLLENGWQYVGDDIWINPLDGLGYTRPSAINLLRNTLNLKGTKYRYIHKVFLPHPAIFEHF